MSTPMQDLPEHFPIGVDSLGMGPVMEHERDFDHYECWCGDRTCLLFKVYMEEDPDAT